MKRGRASGTGAMILYLTLAWISPADAACPASLCDCIGAARNFALVASKLVRVQEGRQTAYQYNYLTGADVVGDICAPHLTASGSVNLPTYFYEGFATRAPGTVAASFTKRIPPGYEGDHGVFASYLSTGGGSVRGLENAGEMVVDTTGTDPGIASCVQAMVDMQAASETLAALPTTQDLGTVLVKGTDLDIVAGPGVNVFSADRIYVLPQKDGEFLEGGRIFIEGVPETEAVIINASGLRIGDVSGIHTTGSIEAIINVPAGGGKITVGRDATSEAMILAPQRSVTVGVQDPDFGMYGLAARRILVKGGTVYENLLTDCP